MGWWGGGPCDFSVSQSPFGLDFGTSDLGLTIFICSNLRKIRIINTVESLDPNISWENVKRVRNYYLMNKHNESCKYLLPNEDIKQNVILFMNLVNSSSSYLQKNLTKDVIYKGAKMFLYLNTCPYVAKANIVFTFFLVKFLKSICMNPLIQE